MTPCGLVGDHLCSGRRRTSLSTRSYEASVFVRRTRKTEISIRHSVRYETGLRARLSAVRFLVRAREFCPKLAAWPVPGKGKRILSKTRGPPPPPFSRWGAGSFPQVKWPGHVENTPPSRAKIKLEWSYTSAPRACIHGVDRGNFVFMLVCVVSSIHVRM
jgi:hypothetical protein